MAGIDHVSKGKHMWIQITKPITQNDWIYKEVAHPNCDEWNEWGYHTKIEFKPKLSNNNLDMCNECHYYHQNITLEFVISSSNSTEHVDLRLGYTPKSSKETDSCLRSFGNQQEHTCQHDLTCKRSYVWMFDICLVKMTFKHTEDSTKLVTRNFHLEAETGKCLNGNHEKSSRDELANFQNSEFFSKVDLETLIGYKMEFGKSSFISVDIEIIARLHLCPLLNEGELLQPDERCALNVSGMQLSESAELAPFTTNAPHSQIETVAQTSICPEIQFLSGSEIQEKLKVIDLEDEETPYSLKLFLTYLYKRTGWNYSVDVDRMAAYRAVDDWDVELSFKILRLSRKYELTDLTQFSVENIISRLDSEFTIELAINISITGLLIKSDDLHDRCTQWLRRHPTQVKERKLKTWEKQEEIHILATEILLHLI